MSENLKKCKVCGRTILIKIISLDYVLSIKKSQIQLELQWD